MLPSVRLPVRQETGRSQSDLGFAHCVADGGTSNLMIASNIVAAPTLSTWQISVVRRSRIAPISEGLRISKPMSMATSKSANDALAQGCTAPTPWLGFVIALVVVAGASVVFAFFKP
jgi:hypothetical protein